MDYKKESFRHLAGKIIACVDLQWLKNELIDQDAKRESIYSVDFLSKKFACNQLQSDNPQLWKNIAQKRAECTETILR